MVLRGAADSQIGLMPIYKKVRSRSPVFLRIFRETCPKTPQPALRLRSEPLPAKMASQGCKSKALRAVYKRAGPASRTSEACEYIQACKHASTRAFKVVAL